MRSHPLALAAATAVLVAAGALATTAQSDLESASRSECERVGRVAHVIPDDVRGTTFTGTYEGDSIGGVGDDHAMITLWSVERVYAGGPLPETLTFQTPACSWVNLTPGTRYLFSTAVTDLGGHELATGTPSVADSLAWELLADGAVRLAPFDTYEVTDYDSEELAAIKTFDDALWSVAPDAGEGAVPESGSTAASDCISIDFTASPERARGTSFVGRYIGDEALPGPGGGDARTYWSLERVYAGGPLPELLTLRSNHCDAVILEPGQRYLFSTSDPLAPDWGNSLAWALTDDGHAHLAPFAGTDEDWYKSSATAPTTLERALALVAPEATDGAAPLRAAGRTPG